jgi:mannitol/fructose-specific phosphotransferase system IIA component (Ntr-type)
MMQDEKITKKLLKSNKKEEVLNIFQNKIYSSKN